jgi:transposase
VALLWVCVDTLADYVTSVGTGRFNVTTRHNSRATYPMELVLEARKMRKYGWTYKEIAEAINDHWKVNVAWITIRDWTLHWYRMSR